MSNPNPTKALRLVRPCAVSWDALPEVDGIRHCSFCQTRVYDLDAMTPAAIGELSAANPTGFCGKATLGSGTLLPIDEDGPGSGAIPRAAAAAVALLSSTLVACVPQPREERTVASSAALTQTVVAKTTASEKSQPRPLATDGPRWTRQKCEDLVSLGGFLGERVDCSKFPQE